MQPIQVSMDKNSSQQFLGTQNYDLANFSLLNDKASNIRPSANNSVNTRFKKKERNTLGYVPAFFDERKKSVVPLRKENIIMTMNIDKTGRKIVKINPIKIKPFLRPD